MDVHQLHRLAYFLYDKAPTCPKQTDREDIDTRGYQNIVPTADGKAQRPMEISGGLQQGQGPTGGSRCSYYVNPLLNYGLRNAIYHIFEEEFIDKG